MHIRTEGNYSIGANKITTHLQITTLFAHQSIANFIPADGEGGDGDGPGQPTEMEAMEMDRDSRWRRKRH